MMKKMKTPHLLRLTLAASLAFAVCNAWAADAVTKVNGVAIPQARMDLVAKLATGRGQPDTAELRNRIREDLIVQEIVAQEAAKKGLDKSADVTMQIELQRQGILAEAYFQDYFKNNPISEETLKKEYEQAKSQSGEKEYRARHILVKDETEAKQIIAQLKKGASFEKIAAAKSEDPGSKARGGDLDWSPSNRYVPPFAEALKKLKKGQLVDAPVQSQFGWHVIRLDDERALKVPGYEEVKAQIQQNLQRQAVQKLVGELRAKAKIE